MSRRGWQQQLGNLRWAETTETSGQERKEGPGLVCNRDTCPAIDHKIKKKVFVILKWLWKGEWSLPQQSILNFMPAAPFKSLKKTLIQVSVAFLKWPFMIHVTFLQWWLEPLRWRGVETKGWISAVAASLQNGLSGHCGWGGVGWQEEELFSVQCSCGKKAWGLWVWLELESVESWEACWLVEWFWKNFISYVLWPVLQVEKSDSNGMIWKIWRCVSHIRRPLQN